jgi:hypothetical protein
MEERQSEAWKYYANSVNIKESSSCWEWTKSCGSPGYGNWHFSIYGLPKAGAAHRRSYMLFNGYVDSSVMICHSCGNRKCCNPNHLYAGTAKDNSRDAMRHGTHKKPPVLWGSQANASKLTESQVINIKLRLQKGEICGNIAKDYGVTMHCIHKIKVGKNWAWLQV